MFTKVFFFKIYFRVARAIKSNIYFSTQNMGKIWVNCRPGKKGRKQNTDENVWKHVDIAFLIIYPFIFRDLIPTQPVNRKLSKVSNILGPYRKEEHKGGQRKQKYLKAYRRTVKRGSRLLSRIFALGLGISMIELCLPSTEPIRRIHKLFWKNPMHKVHIVGHKTLIHW